MKAVEDKMENQASQVDVRDGCKVEGMTQSAHERQGLMTANENQIVVYQPNETVRLDVRLENETVWLTQSQMATLFGCSTDNIGLHLKNVYAVGELSREATTEDFSVVRKEVMSSLCRREDGRRNHPRSSRLDPQSDIGTPRI